MASQGGREAVHTQLGEAGVAGRARPRRLLLCLDGVPHELIARARVRGLFEHFREPARLLSPFPTMTNVALSTMLRASPPAGYESLYFDTRERCLRGGARKYVGRRTPDKIPSSYMGELDYQEPLAFEFLIYVATERVWRADMRRFRERFRAAPAGRDFFAFLKATDGLLHIGGPARLEVALRSLDRILREIREHCGDETEIVLFSDHGMSLREHRRVHLKTHLRHAGYEAARCLDAGGRGGARRRVAVPAFGLCSYAALYCGDEAEPAEVAASLASLEGVDFGTWRDGAESVLVRSARGTARIRRAETGAESDRSGADEPGAEQPRAGGAVRFAYEPLDGDPLRLAPVLEALRREGELDAQGFAADAAWFARTAGHEYPDALANVHGSLHAPRVRHTADLLLSLHDGYYYGNAAFGRAARRLLATHGNALRPSSTAFLMSTHRDFPAFVRSDEARPLLRG